jgi:sulfur relay protein TusB/DsrH
MERKNEILYLFGFSPNKVMQLENLLKILKAQITNNKKITLVLLHDGVIGLSKMGNVPKLTKDLIELPIKIYGLIPDFIARGINIEDIHQKVSCIQYEELADLIASIPTIASWM